MESRSKHGPNRLRSYQQIHSTVLARFVREGFVLSDELSFRDMGDGAIILDGQLECLGEIVIVVDKLLKVQNGDVGSAAMVQTTSYSYQATLKGVGTILRYDSPHPTHNQFHHVHRYDVLGGDKEGELERIDGENDVPTLGEVIHEVRDWYFTNLDAIARLR